MKRIWPYVFIFITVITFFRPVLFNRLLPIPSDTIVGLYHPFRDMYAQDYPRGVPFKNFLITDPVRQLIPWKYLAITQEKSFQLPLWNPYNFAGTPLLANFQTGAFYPLNILFFFFPFTFAWSIFIFLQPLLGGIFLYLYLRNLKLHPLAATVGSISFIFSGFSMVWLEWGNVLHTLLWVPLILLAKDKLLLKWTTKWTIVLLFAEVCAFFAGHVQIWFYSILLTNGYLLLRIYQKIQATGKKQFIFRFVATYMPFLLVGIFVFLVTAIQSIPTLQFILHSARSVDQNYLTTKGWFIPYQNLLQFVVPDFFGNPATLNYWGVWNYAEFVGYIGILPLFFALFAIFFRRDKKTWFYTAVVLIALLLALPTPIGQLPFQLNLPFFSTSQPTRILSIVDLSLAILAAFGIDYFIKRKTFQILWVCIGMSALFVILWSIILKININIPLENIIVTKRNLVFPSIFVMTSSFVIIFGILFRFKRWLILFGILLLVITSADLIRFSEKFTPFTLNSYLFPQEKTLTFLQKNTENYRYMTTDSRILAPNFSIMYKLQSIDGYDPLYVKNYAELIAATEREKPDIHSPFGFNRIITPHNYNSRMIDLLGVKYILSLEELHIQKLEKVYQEGQTRVYENKNVFPRAFFVTDIVYTQDSQSAINQLFANKNLTSVAIVNKMFDKKTFTKGNVTIKLYQPNEILLQTDNNGEGFLVLTDIYYPTWKVQIDGVSSSIYRTDYAFRGVVVPKGKHTIVFSDHLF